MSDRRSGTAPDRRRNRASAAGRGRTPPPANSDGPPHGRDPRHGSPDLVSNAHLPSRHPTLPGLRSPKKAGHKKPGLNIRFGRDPIVPGLFSKLFNVAASRPAQMTTERLKNRRGRAIRQGTPGVNGTARGGAAASL